ncbi:MAG: 4Fe-4S binding protein [Desulfotalea sp.]
MSNNHLIYFSATGTGKTVGTCIAGNLFNGESYDVTDLTYESAASNYDQDDVVIFVAPVYAGRVAPLAVDRMKGLRGNNSRAVIIVMYGNRNYDDSLLELSDLVTDLGFIPIAAGACVGEHSYSTVEKEIGAGRPDADDLAKLGTYFKELSAKIRREPFKPLTNLPGNRPYKEGLALSFPLHPEHDKDKCMLCGLCGEVCPLGSITVTDVHTQVDNCLLCCACVKSCPEGALSLTDGGVVEARKRLYEMCKERREIEFFTLLD